jgi:hypothetical protein
MALEASNMDEITQLLDQCNPDELAKILSSIETGNFQAHGYPNPPVLQPTPPATSPTGGNRRPVPTNLATAAKVEAPTHSAPTSPTVASVTMDDIKKILEEHSAGVLDEVRRLIPSISNGVMESIDIATLTQSLAERDIEVKELEDKLASLQHELALKDKEAADLTNELDTTLREVRHRQLDLEFQQLKLEERVRSNAELEQAQRLLTSKVEEVSLNARHAAIDAESRTCYTPRSMRAQGSLPWMLRKNRLPAVGDIPYTPR